MNNVKIPVRYSPCWHAPMVVDADDHFFCECLTQQLAFEISKCVNSHDALVEALKVVVKEFLDDSHMRQKPYVSQVVIEALRLAGEGVKS